MKIILDQQTSENIREHAEADYPNECCGFLFGDNTRERAVTQVIKVSNAKEGDQRRRFEISPEDYRKAESYAEEHGLDLLGVYHSHPDHPAEPSEQDRRVALPFFSYIIVSVPAGEAADIRSWQLNDERQFEEETLVTTELATHN